MDYSNAKIHHFTVMLSLMQIGLEIQITDHQLAPILSFLLTMLYRGHQRIKNQLLDQLRLNIGLLLLQPLK